MEPLRYGSERQDTAEGDNAQRSRHDRTAGPALDKRNLVGPDDINDHRLREERLHEPAGSKHRRIGRAIKHEPHNAVSHEIKDGTDRPDGDDEFLDEADMPRTRFLQIILVHIIGRCRDLAHVVQEIIQEYLRRQHWQEGQDDRSAGHG